MENLEVKKLRRKNNVLITLLVILIISILVGTVYLYFAKENNKNDISVDVSKLTEEINFNYLLDNKTKEVKDLSIEEMLLVAFNSFGRELSYYEREFSSPSDYDANSQLPLVDDNGVVYPDYSKEKQPLYCNDIEESFVNVGQIKNWAREIGMNVTQIEKMDTSLFSCYGAGGSIDGSMYVFDSDVISSKMKEIFGTDNNIFNKSFPYVENKSTNICGNYLFTYDKNTDKLFLSISGGCSIYNLASTSVIKEYMKGDLYKMDIVEYMIGEGFYEDSYPKEVKIYNVEDFKKDYPEAVVTITIESEEAEKDIGSKILQYKDKLDNYTLNFKKVGDNYQFVSIDYIK